MTWLALTLRAISIAVDYGGVQLLRVAGKTARRCCKWANA
jgi:hypothetical protein